MTCAFTRRTFTRLMAAAGIAPGLALDRVQAQPAAAAFSYPMRLPDRAAGDGLTIRHGYATENTWFNPGWWHTGEDWYLTEGDSAGAGVYAIADGEVVFAGSEYPGLVVIIQHADGLFSMYGHLDYTLAVETGQPVARGDALGTVLARTDGRAPSHLHFEVRTFFTTPEVNGDAPRYGVACGVNCPPGPGYWPIDAPEHPSAMGWRNPTHAINRRAWGAALQDGAMTIVTTAAPENVPLWTLPADLADAVPAGDLALTPGDQYPLLAVATGEEASTGTSAEAYRLWHQIALDGEQPWVQAAVPSTAETGSDGRPSTVLLVFVPMVGDG